MITRILCWLNDHPRRHSYGIHGRCECGKRRHVYLWPCGPWERV